MTVDLLNFIYEATSKRQPDFIVATELKNIIDGNEEIIPEVASVLLEQAFQGTMGNNYVLAYLKYCLRADLITPCSIFCGLPTFKPFDAPETLSLLLNTLDDLIRRVTQTRVSDPVQRTCQSLITLVTWLTNSIRHLIQRIHEQPELWTRQGENFSTMISFLHTITSSKKCCCLLYIASIEDPEMWQTAVQSVGLLKADASRLNDTRQMPNICFQLENLLKQMESQLPLFEQHVQKLATMLTSEANSSCSQGSSTLPLEMILCSPSSVLFNSCSIESSFGFLRELQIVLNLSSDQVLKSIFSVGLTALPLKEYLYQSSTVMLIRVPQIISMYKNLGENVNLFSIIVSFYKAHNMKMKQSPQKQLLFFSFLHMLVNQNSISRNEAANLGYQGQTEISESLVVIHTILEKIINEKKPAKIIEHFEKMTVDIDGVLYVGSASGYLNKLVNVLVSASMQETTKDAVFGSCFLILFRIHSLFGSEPFRMVASQSSITAWFNSFFNGTKVRKASVETISSPEAEQVLSKLQEMPKKGTDGAGPAMTILGASQYISFAIITATAQGLITEDKASTLFSIMRDHSRTGFMASYVSLVITAAQGSSKTSGIASRILPIHKNTKIKSKLAANLYQKNCSWLEETFFKSKIADPKETLTAILKKLSNSLRPTQQQMNQIEECADRLGTDMFVRILTSSIMKQKRRDLAQRACSIAIGASSVDWVGVPLSLIWYQLPEVLGSVEHATVSDPFALFLATELHFLSIFQRNKGMHVISLPTDSQRMLIELAGKERYHFHGKLADHRRLITQGLLKDVRMMDRLESLASIRSPVMTNASDPFFIKNAFHSVGRTLLLSLTNPGPHLPVDFCLTLLDKIICPSVSTPNTNIENVLNILQYLPFSFLNHLLQIAGIHSQVPAVLLSVVDLQLPKVRTKVAHLISLGEARPLP